MCEYLYIYIYVATYICKDLRGYSNFALLMCMKSNHIF